MSRELTSFRSILDALEVRERRAQLLFPDDWAQGRGTFGGLVSAAVLRAMRTVVGLQRRPRSVTSSFVGPVIPGRADLTMEVLREGGSWSHLQGRVEQGGSVRAIIHASFGAERDSSVEVKPAPRPEVPRAEQLVEFPFVPGVTPTCTQHFEYRWAVGHVPFSQSAEREIGGWCRFREDQGIADECALLALVDAWPAPVLPMLSEPAPASTISWAVSFGELDWTARTDGWWYFGGRTTMAAGGGAVSTATLWAPSGLGVATSQQLVAVFDSSEPR